MSEKRKYIPVPAWVENAINMRRKETRRSWRGEAETIIEDYLLEHFPELVAKAKKEAKAKASS